MDINQDDLLRSFIDENGNNVVHFFEKNPRKLKKNVEEP